MVKSVLLLLGQATYVYKVASKCSRNHFIPETNKLHFFENIPNAKLNTSASECKDVGNIPGSYFQNAYSAAKNRSWKMGLNFVLLILINNQHDAQFFFLINIFQFSTCFEQHSAHHQESQLYQYNFWCIYIYIYIYIYTYITV